MKKEPVHWTVVAFQQIMTLAQTVPKRELQEQAFLIYFHHTTIATLGVTRIIFFRIINL